LVSAFPFPSLLFPLGAQKAYTKHTSRGLENKKPGHCAAASGGCCIPPCRHSGRLATARHSPRAALWQRVWCALVASVQLVRLASARPARRQATAKHSFFPARPSPRDQGRGALAARPSSVGGDFSASWFWESSFCQLKYAPAIDETVQQADCVQWLASTPLLPAKWPPKATLHAFNGSPAEHKRQKPSRKRRRAIPMTRRALMFPDDSLACASNITWFPKRVGGILSFALVGNFAGTSFARARRIYKWSRSQIL